MITRTYPLEKVNDGYADMHAGANIRGVLIYPPASAPDARQGRAHGPQSAHIGRFGDAPHPQRLSANVKSGRELEGT